MTINHHRAAMTAVASAGRWIGDEPVVVSAPVEAQIATAQALLALVDEVKLLRMAVEEMVNRG